jgi:broad specificity phosphatase PhoE
MTLRFGDEQVREYHRKYFEEGTGTRDVLIVAHGHFNRVFISRWLEFPLALGISPLLLLLFGSDMTSTMQEHISTSNLEALVS